MGGGEAGEYLGPAELQSLPWAGLEERRPGSAAKQQLCCSGSKEALELGSVVWWKEAPALTWSQGKEAPGEAWGETLRRGAWGAAEARAILGLRVVQELEQVSVVPGA